ncbi:MAG: hypothetical protein I8H75_03780 [Myxococcaceae bacterium]|nr:hypothetical protein [Myxococcaceae bacterium]MBH2006447.1 hypothetical protein [Myxococcaceae bacterium]
MTPLETKLLPLGLAIAWLLIQASFRRSRILAQLVSLAPLWITLMLSSNRWDHLVLASAIGTLLLSFYRIQEHHEEFGMLLLLTTLGALTLVAAEDFMTFFIGLELMTLPVYGLIAWHPTHPQPLHSGLKYLILSGVSTATLLLGIAFTYAQSGTLRLALASPLGSALILVGIGFKLSLVPFHLWTGDVYADSPWCAMSTLATVSKAAVISLLPKLNFDPKNLKVLGLIAILSMLGGSLLMLRQQNLARFLAYSSIAHMGFALAGWMVQADITYYMAAYLLSVWILLAGSNSRFFTILGLFSLMGLPVLPLFWGKYQILLLAFSHRNWPLFGFFLASSLIGVYGYARMIAKSTQEKVIL